MTASTDPTRPTDQDPHDGPPADPNDPPDAPWRHPNLPLDPDRPLWVFGYGSLMWNPEFPHTDRRMALLHGYHRRFCVYSHRYRGTPEKPGLVLGLDHGGSCHGVAFEVAPRDATEVLAYLWGREMVTGVYRPRLLPLDLADGRRVKACCFVADRRHRQYCGGLDADRTLTMILNAEGARGPNAEYLLNTVDHLDALGIEDAPLHALAARVRSHRPG